MAGNKKEIDLEKSVDFINFCSGMNRLPIYEIICERFTRGFRVSLSNWIRMISTIEYSHDVVRFGDWVAQSESPTSMCVFRCNNLKGPIVVNFKQKLAYGILDSVLGGSGKELNTGSKEFTQLELTMMKDVYNMVQDDWEQAFQPVHPIKLEYIRQEINPQFVGIVPPDSKVIVTTFKTSFEKMEGEFQIIVPYSTIFPIRDKLFNNLS